MTIELELQIASDAQTLPHPAQFREWVGHTLSDRIDAAELTIRIVDVDEMTELNETYRHKEGPTNVLSFPYDMPADLTDELPLLGDIVICAAVVHQEAQDQKKSTTAHWAHMVIHGTLHLLGYDHEIPTEADKMEALEITILKELGFPNPYQQGEQ